MRLETIFVDERFITTAKRANYLREFWIGFCCFGPEQNQCPSKPGLRDPERSPLASTLSITATLPKGSDRIQGQDDQDILNLIDWPCQMKL